MPCWRFQALYKIREPFTIYHFGRASSAVIIVWCWSAVLFAGKEATGTTLEVWVLTGVCQYTSPTTSLYGSTSGSSELSDIVRMRHIRLYSCSQRGFITYQNLSKQGGIVPSTRSKAKTARRRPLTGALFHRQGPHLGGPIIPVSPLCCRLSRCPVCPVCQRMPCRGGPVQQATLSEGSLTVEVPYQKSSDFLPSVPFIVRSAQSPSI